MNTVVFYTEQCDTVINSPDLRLAGSRFKS